MPAQHQKQICIIMTLKEKRNETGDYNLDDYNWPEIS